MYIYIFIFMYREIQGTWNMNVSTCFLYCIFDAVAFLFVFFSFTFNFPNFLIELKCITFYFVFILYHIKMNMLGNQSYLPRSYYFKLSFPSLPVTSGKEGWFDSFSVLCTLVRVALCSSLGSIPHSCPYVNKSAILWAGLVLLLLQQKVLRHPRGAKPSSLTCQFQETTSICLVKRMLHCCALNLSC